MYTKLFSLIVAWPIAPGKLSKYTFRCKYGLPRQKTLSITTTQHNYSIITFSIMTLSTRGLFATLNITILCHYAEYRYAECGVLFNIMVSVIILNVVMLIVVAPSVKHEHA